jgi:protein SCO1
VRHGAKIPWFRPLLRPRPGWARGALAAPRTAGVAVAVLLSAGLAGPAIAEDLRGAPQDALSFADADGRVVLSSDFPGKWLLIYFGYMHCSDLCPTGLSVLANALDQIGPAAAQIQPLFVTVDPERDRGPELRRFAEAFDKRLIGLGGSLADIKRAAAALGVSFEKVAQSDAGYVVDHSSGYVLIDPARQSVHSLRFAEPHLLAAKLIAVMAAAGTPLGAINNIGAYR